MNTDEGVSNEYDEGISNEYDEGISNEYWLPYRKTLTEGNENVRRFNKYWLAEAEWMEETGDSRTTGSP